MMKQCMGRNCKSAQKFEWKMGVASHFFHSPQPGSAPATNAKRDSVTCFGLVEGGDWDTKQKPHCHVTIGDLHFS